MITPVAHIATPQKAGFEDGALAMLNPLEPIEWRSVVKSTDAGKMPKMVLALAFAVELFPPFRQ